jgi:endonuclease/exonuclease/phosphatase (EEP) superfamily protein YafD
MWMVVGWVVVACLAAVVASSVLRLPGLTTLSIIQDGMMILLGAAWAVLIIAIWAQAWGLAVAAGLLVVHHLALLVSKATANRVPRWVAEAPKLKLLIANVYVDNETPGDLARVLLACGADVIVIAEWNTTFVTAFDAEGGLDAYPHRVFDPDDMSDYAVGIVSRVALAPQSEMTAVGPLKVAMATVEVGGTQLTILGVNPMATVDPGGLEEWSQQMDALVEFLPSAPIPHVLAGDLNTTTNRPKVREVMRTGLVDAHESIGDGLSASFKLSASGVLAAPGAVVRLDHAMLSDGVRAVRIDDLDSAGSDHVPFAVVLAVRAAGPRRRRRRLRTRRESNPRSTRGQTVASSA